MNDLIKRLRDAADAVMAHQWSGNRERMNALHELCQAEIAATEAFEAQAKRIAELEAERDAAVAEVNWLLVVCSSLGSDELRAAIEYAFQPTAQEKQ